MKCSSGCPWRCVGETERSLQDTQAEEHDQEIDLQWSEVARYTVEDGHLVEMQDMAVIDMQREQVKEVD